MVRIAARGPVTGISAWQAASPRARALVGKGRDRSAQRPKPRHRVDPAVAARAAGDRGRHADPMGEGNRTNVYWRQNGCRKLTPKQRRRIDHKVKTFVARKGGEPS